jgi:tetratricopeptide (TPR) repeat protein
MSELVNRQSPWPGSASYREEHSDYFFGRTAEVAELLREVEDEPLVVLYGRSGLGKTSLLQAGLFPRLRRQNFLPLLLRPNHKAGADRSPTGHDPRYSAQVIEQSCARAHDAKAESPASADKAATLWEYFHDRRAQFWSEQHRLLTPVLVFDQFEEFFQSEFETEASRRNTGRFFQELSDLIFNNVPASIGAGLDRGEVPPDRFNFDQIPIRVVLSLREDFLPQLDDLSKPGFPDPARACFPNLYRAKVRLQPLSPEAARECIEQPAPELIKSGKVADRILDGLISAKPPKCVEPAMLNIVCRKLNEERTRLGERQIGDDLFGLTPEQILNSFYENCWVGLGSGLRVFVEDELVNRAGFRDSRDLDDACRKLGPGSAADIQQLVNRLLLQYRDEPAGRRIELIHDRFCPFAQRSRDERERREQERKARETEMRVEEEARKARAEAAAAEASRAEEQRRREEADRLRNEAENAHREAEVAYHRARRGELIAKAIAVVALAATVGVGYFAWQAVTQKRRAVSDEESASGLISEMQNDSIQPILTTITQQGSLGRFGQLNMVKGIEAKTVEYYRQHPPLDPTSRLNQCLSLEEEGASLAIDDVADSEKKAQADFSNALTAASSLTDQDTGKKHREWWLTLADCYDHLGDLAFLEGNNDGALSDYQEALDVRDSLPAPTASNGGKEWQKDREEWQRAMAASFDHLGDVLSAEGRQKLRVEPGKDLAPIDGLPGIRVPVSDAAAAYGNAFLIRRDLARPDAPESERDLATSEDHLGDIAQNLPADLVASVENLLGLADPNPSPLEVARICYQRSLYLREKHWIADPGNAEFLHDLATSLGHLAQNIQTQANKGASSEASNADRALEEEDDVVEIQRQLFRQDSTNPTWEFELIGAIGSRGGILEDHGHLDEAEADYKESLDLRLQLAAQHPDAKWQLKLATGYDHLGDIYRKEGILQPGQGGDRAAAGDNALDNYQKAEAIRSSIITGDEKNHSPVVQHQHDMAASFSNLGAVFELAGELDQALDNYNHALSIRKNMAEAQPDNTSWKADLASSYDSVGDILKEQQIINKSSAVGDTSALDAYNSSYAIRKSLADKDPNNAQYAYDLAGSDLDIGDVKIAAASDDAKPADVPGALESYEAAFKIMDKLASQDRSNLKWQNQLALSYDGLGKVAEAGKRWQDALGYYQSCVAIELNLVQKEPTNPEWQSELALNLDHRGKVEEELGETTKAGQDFQDSLGSRQRLAANYPQNAQWQYDVAVSQDHVGDVAEDKGHLSDAARDHVLTLQEEEALMGRMPNHSSWLENLRKSFSDLREILQKERISAEGEGPAAFATYREDVASAIPVVESFGGLDPGYAGWKDVLADYKSQADGAKPAVLGNGQGPGGAPDHAAGGPEAGGAAPKGQANLTEEDREDALLISGDYDLEDVREPGTTAARMTIAFISINSANFIIKAKGVNGGGEATDAWCGEGKVMKTTTDKEGRAAVTRTADYNWLFSDGREGHTTVKVVFDGKSVELEGHVVGSGIDWNYVAKHSPNQETGQ